MENNQKPKILLIIAIILAFVILGGLSFWFLGSNSSNKKSVDGKNVSVSKDIKRTFTEAPFLEKRVLANELPKISERMPKNPLIVVPLERLGVYGGTWHLVAKSKSDHNSFLRNIGYENLVRWNVNWTDIIPNVAQSYEVSPDAKEYTFYLREGMKWSDGAPFTADDVVFWYEDIFLNKELTPAYQDWLASNGKPIVLTKINDYEFKVTFSEPNSLFLQSIAQPKGAEFVAYPKHYLSQFLPKYNKNLDAKTWVDQFKSKFGNIGTPDNENRWQHPEVPTLNAWIMLNTYDGKAKRIIADRNPYYWKIDPAGNQLPYIDTLEYVIEDDNQKIINLGVEGKLDMQDRNVGNNMLSIAGTRPVLEKGAATGGYSFFKTVFATMNTMVISFNLNHKDPVLREIFQNKDFRIGLSYAIDRKKIIFDIYGDHGEPYQSAPRPESPFYDKEMAKQYTEYDPAKANEYLDKAGLTKKDSSGYRVRPDGKRLTFTVDWGDARILAMIQANWKAVGVDMKVGNTTDRTAYYIKKNNKDHDVAVWTGDGGIDVMQEPRYYFPYGSTNESNYALGWGYWHVDPKNPLAEEPPQIVKDQMDLYSQISKTLDVNKQNDYMKQILKIAKDQFYTIGISLPVDGFGIVKNNFHNVPQAMPAAFTYPNPAPTNPSQYFIE